MLYIHGVRVLRSARQELDIGLLHQGQECPGPSERYKTTRSAGRSVGRAQGRSGQVDRHGSEDSPLLSATGNVSKTPRTPGVGPEPNITPGPAGLVGDDVTTPDRRRPGEFQRNRTRYRANQADEVRGSLPRRSCLSSGDSTSSRSRWGVMIRRSLCHVNLMESIRTMSVLLQLWTHSPQKFNRHAEMASMSATSGAIAAEDIRDSKRWVGASLRRRPSPRDALERSAAT